MKILLASHLFRPSVGGIETVTLQLATEFARRGHAVTVATQSPAAGPEEFPFAVVRRPGPAELWRLAGECDVYFSNNISLKLAWPLLRRRPWVIAHHTWIAQPDGSRGWRERLKLRLLRRARNIAVSRAIAAHLGAEADVIENPYDDGLFRELGLPERGRDLMFLGRLVSDKGCDLLLEAMGRLETRGVRPRLTVIGSGPERENLERQAVRLGVADRVEFAGTHTGEDLVRLLNGHRVLVVPSRWNEPFGLIALEAIACGCVVVGSSGGGLPDAMGPCGITFPNGDVDALAEAIRSLLDSPALCARLRQGAEAHLARHRRAVVAGQYLEVLKTVGLGSPARPVAPITIKRSPERTAGRAAQPYLFTVNRQMRPEQITIKEWLRKNAPALAYALKAVKERVAPTRLRAGDQAVVNLVCGGVPRVMRGPFAGMRYINTACGSAFPSKLVGCYEEEVQDWIPELLARRPGRILDIGSAEGYYAVGFALRAPEALVYAFDTDPVARYFSRRLARMNGVRNRVRVAGACTHAWLRRVGGPGSLVICDCEGAEAELLDPEAAPCLASSDMLVEFHDFVRAGVSALLRGRFEATHDIRIAEPGRRRLDRYPEMQRLSEDQRQYVLYERPDWGQRWGLFLSRNR